MPQMSILFILCAHNSSPGIKRELVQLIHLNSSHAAEHSSPLFLHVGLHIRVSQSVLHWHLTTFKRSSGADGKYVVRGSCRSCVWSHPHFLGTICPTSPSTHELRNTRVHCGGRQQRLLEGDCAIAH